MFNEITAKYIFVEFKLRRMKSKIYVFIPLLFTMGFSKLSSFTNGVDVDDCIKYIHSLYSLVDVHNTSFYLGFQIGSNSG